MRILLFVFLIVCSHVGFTQITPPQFYVKNFYDALNKGDSVDMTMHLSKDFKVIHYDEDTTFSFDLDGFLTICPKFRSGRFYEKFEINQIIEYPGKTIVEVEFMFVLNGEHDHCGKDIVVMENEAITEIHSYVVPCKFISMGERIPDEWDAENVDQLLSKWHAAASRADFKAYFSFMASDFYFLGTDPTERWNKEQFANFCRPHFDNGKAWDFKVLSRNIYISDDGNTIWFDEKLDTWMEDCRGSGVLQRKKLTNENGMDEEWGGWELKHYNLTVLIENDKIKDFIHLRQE